MARSVAENLSLKLPGGFVVHTALALDAIRGATFIYDAAVFPHNINLASTWNPELAKQQGTITGRDLRICGWNIALAPAVDKYEIALEASAAQL